MPSKNSNLQSPLKPILHAIKKDKIEFLQIRYTDVPGRFLASYISEGNDHFGSVFRDGVGLDGSSVKGFADVNESDLLLMPDMSTVRLIQATPTGNIVSVIANVYRGFGEGRLPTDPRYVSQTMESYLAENGMSCQIGAEVECFIFDDIAFENIANKNLDKSCLEPKIISVEQYGTGKYPIRTKGGYNAPPFQDSLKDFRFEVAQILKKYHNINVTNMIHEALKISFPPIIATELFKGNALKLNGAESNIPTTISYSPELAVRSNFPLFIHALTAEERLNNLYNAWISPVSGIWTFLAGIAAVITPLIIRKKQKDKQR
jgi:hypothetical protein